MRRAAVAEVFVSDGAVLPFQIRSGGGYHCTKCDALSTCWKRPVREHPPAGCKQRERYQTDESKPPQKSGPSIVTVLPGEDV
jgi:hypothetical protein